MSARSNSSPVSSPHAPDRNHFGACARGPPVSTLRRGPQLPNPTAPVCEPYGLHPTEWQPRLTELLSDAGVAFVIADTFQGARANGATQWLTPSKALLQLSLRYRWEDIFWFSFFHEAAHVALHRKKGVFVDGLAVADPSVDVEAQRLEHEADRFAARMLIPEEYEARIRQLRFSEIQAFADELEIAPAIVVGRLQHEGLMHYRESVKYKRRLHFVD